MPASIRSSSARSPGRASSTSASRWRKEISPRRSCASSSPRQPRAERRARQSVRVWDVSPAYLSRQSLLGEHRELHAIYVILTEHRAGYARHPETLRWTNALGGLVARHAQLVAEMRLRGYTDRSPL